MSGLAARSPRSRKSIRSSLGERNLNTEQNQEDQQANFRAKGKARMSIGGGEDASTLTSPSKITFAVGRKGTGNDLSPRSQARRKAVPRKSILKSISAPSIPQLEEHEPSTADTHGESTMVMETEQRSTFQFQAHGQNLNLKQNENNTGTFNNRRSSMFGGTTLGGGGGGDNHTFAYGSMTQSQAGGKGGRPSLAPGRRVSFAPSAHIRMFDPSSQRNAANPSSSSGSSGKPNIFAQPPAAPAPPSGPRPSTSSHSRRSSIQNLAAISQPQSPSQGGGEESMELESETDSEMDGSDDDDLVNQSLYLVPAPAQQDEEEEDEQSMEMTQNFGGGIINGDADESYDTSEADTSIQSDGSKTMDFTWAVGGILPTSAPENAQRGRASLGYSHLHPGEVEGTLIPGEGDDDEMEMEMDMDETRAFGGIIQPDDSLSSTEDTINHQHHERTQTFSINDLRAAAAAEQSAMDMTTAMGGIITGSQSQPPSRQERSINIFAQAQSQSQSRSSATSTLATSSLSVSVSTREPASPMVHQPPKSPMVGHQSITRPMSGTPSFARPTTASASKTRTRSPEKPKERRNIFGPSPSPFKSTTPRKSGMQTAGEVAKRLSFGSAAGGGSASGSAKKRSRQSEVDEEEEGDGDKENEEPITGSPAKRQRLSQPRAPPLGESVFGRPSLSMSVQEPSPPRTVSPAPAPPPAPAPEMTAAPSPIRATAATPVKSVSRVTSTPGKSPKSPAIRRAMGVPVIPVEEERPDDWEPETIGLGAFLEMAGVQFIDTLPGMNRRRSSVGRGRLGQSGIGKDRDFAPYDYTDAKVNSVFLNMYNWATGRIKSDITAGQSDLASTESIYSQSNPPVIKEYLAANDEDKQLFELTFKAFKTNTQLKARAKWYEWKAGILENIRPDVEDVYNEVKADEERLDGMMQEADTYLPQLRERAQQLRQELERERAEVVEIEKCDQVALKEWREVIKEQQIQVDSKLEEVRDKINKLEDYKIQLNGLTTIHTAHETAIAQARRWCDQHTKSDVVNIRRDYESLQTLHQWKLDFLRADRLEMTYAEEIRLCVDCTNFVPNTSTKEVVLIQPQTQSQGKEGTPRHPMTESLFGLLRANLNMKSRSKLTLPQLVQRVGSLWASAQRLRREMSVLTLLHPTSYAYSADTAGATQKSVVSSTMLFKSTRSKIRLQFHFGPESLVDFPSSLVETKTSVKVVYGQINGALIKAKADEYISQFPETGYHAGFASTCLAISEEFDL